MNTFDELIQAGRLDEGLTGLQAEIRNKPEDVRLRILLFQLNCVLGRYDKALTQLQVIASLNAEAELMARIFQPVIACEMLRIEVFAGKRTPLIFGEPKAWMGALLQANALLAAGELAAASESRNQALADAPATAGKINGEPFEWIADADSRLGPMLEAYIDGKYYWVPFDRIQQITMEKPADLRDLIWSPAQFTWVNGGSVAGHIPVRYSGTEISTDNLLRLARKTEWHQPHEQTFLGRGQRIFTTDANDSPILECRTVELTPAV